MAADWAEEEGESADFGDQRLSKRFKRLLTNLYDLSRNSIPAACGGWNETLAAYRFFDNANVNIEKVLSPHHDATLRRIGASAVVLIVQDTTHLIRERTKQTEQIRGIRATEKIKTFLHASVAFTPARTCLGVVRAEHWERKEKKEAALQAMKPIEEKESLRWLEGYGAACAVQGYCSETLVVSIADRESDIHEMYLEAQSYVSSTRAAWIVRAKHNRQVDGEPACRLREHLEKTAVLGQTEFTLPPLGNRPARQVMQTLQASAVPLKAVTHHGKTLEGVTLHAILVKEIVPPEGEQGIDWVLLTNLPIDTPEQVETLIQWYRCRWEIEIYFRVLKNGSQVEKLQLETRERFEVCLGIYMIIAWRLLFMTMLARQCPQLPCDVILDEAEWQALYITVKRTPPPLTPPTLAEAIDMMAKLGGYLGRKNDGPPGTKTVWIGIQRTRDFTLAIIGYKESLVT